MPKVIEPKKINAAGSRTRHKNNNNFLMNHDSSLLNSDFEKIKELCKSPNTTLEQVLDDPLLINSVQMEINEVISFLCRSSSIRKLLQYSLGHYEINDNKVNFRYSKIATIIICSSCYDLQNKILNSKIYEEAIDNFFESKGINSGYICGNYQKVVDSFVSFSHGNFIDNMCDLILKIVNNVDKTAICFLLFNLLCSYADSFENINEIFETISSHIRNGSHLTLPLLSLIIDLLIYCKNVFKLLNKSVIIDLFEALLTLCSLDKSCDLQKAEGFRVLEKFISLFNLEEFYELLDKFEDKLDFNSNGINGIAIFRVYKNKISNILQKFYQNKYNYVIASIALNSFKKINKKDLPDVIESNELVKNLMEMYDSTNKCLGHVDQFILYLRSLNDISSSLRTEKWNTFLSTTFEQKMRIINNKNYGIESPDWKDNKKLKVENVDFNFDDDFDDVEDDYDFVQKEKLSDQLIHKHKIANFTFSDDEEENEYPGEEEEEEENKDDECEQQESEDSYQKMMSDILGISFNDYNSGKPEKESSEEEEEFSSEHEEEYSSEHEEECSSEHEEECSSEHEEECSSEHEEECSSEHEKECSSEHEEEEEYV